MLDYRKKIMFIKKIKYFLLIILSVLLVISCSKKQEPVKKTYDTKQMLLLVLSKKQDVESVCGSEIWNTFYNIDNEDLSFEDIFCQDMNKFILELKTLSIMADEKGIGINADEDAKLKEIANNYLKLTQKSEIKMISALSFDDIYTLLIDYTKAVKMKNDILTGNGLEVSENEARVIDAYKIILNSGDEAKSVKEKLDDGEDFKTVANTYSTDKKIEAIIKRGDYKKELEDIIYNLSDDEISDILEYNGKYYIFKIVNSYNKELTKNNKKRLMNEKTLHELGGVCDSYTNEKGIEVDAGKWAELENSVGGTLDIEGFFDFYGGSFDVGN